MANDIAGNPLIIDTVADNIITGLIQITKIMWEPIAVDDQVVIKNGVGRVIYDKTLHDLGTANNQTLPEIPDSDFIPPFITRGLSVTTLGVGNKLHIYHSSPNPVQ